MKTRALLIPAGGPASLIEVDTGDDQLEELQALVGGFFEAISGPGWVAFLNEDGRYATYRRTGPRGSSPASPAGRALTTSSAPSCSSAHPIRTVLSPM